MSKLRASTYQESL